MTAVLRSRLGVLASHLALLAGAALTLAPFLLSVLTSLTSPQQFAAEGPLSWPDPVTGANYAQLFTRYEFVTPVVVTAQVVLVILVGQLVFSVFAAYAFARLEFPGRDALFWVYLATLMVPQAVTIIPLYSMMTAVGLRNTFWALVLPYLFGSPYAVFLLREHFRGIPGELIDAARLDGCGTLRILRHVVVPVSKPILTTLAVITVVTHWNNFLWPLVITAGPQWRVITVATAGLQSQYNGNWTVVTAATTLAVAPLLVLFLVFQRNVVRSITITGFR
ncbi:carbohydrate ABC transporter membrane protein 2, CUT1 family [Pseudonocardia thermophila]|uniref:Carbohydrate ABC transporter membrane protein 2, CUT1 family n=1 Tax=Pseudonocardia thermophila TaxID=1848 RepID=A0A1M6VXD5_PSETH|nr:carbohydrate ABC transporter permease [Pseudonocardia thermophila]SHK86140.1 carbohydrate ABC transporter membrane protein 2, CUT1 family [Pseudonocardia thermophila]